MKREEVIGEVEFNKNFEPEPLKTGKERKLEIAGIEQLIDECRSKPCVDCGIVLPPPVMNLDHVRSVRSFSVTKWAARIYSRWLVESEITKCDVRCPTCHGLRHYWLRRPADPFFLSHPPYPSWIAARDWKPEESQAESLAGTIPEPV